MVPMRIEPSSLDWRFRRPNSSISLSNHSNFLICKTISGPVSVTLEADFCIEMTKQSLLLYNPEIFCSDQGRQFTCDEMGQILGPPQIQGSMTGAGRCMNNIYIERFWKSVKYEDVRFKDYRPLNEARALVSKHITFYNERRLHQHLHYQTPKEVWTQIKVEPFIYQEQTKNK